MAAANPEPKEFLEQILKMRQLGKDGAALVAIDIAKMPGAGLFLAAMKKGTEALDLQEVRPERKVTTKATRLINTIRANQSFIMHLLQGAEAHILDFEKFSLRGTPPSKADQLKEYFSKSDELKMYLTTLLNIAESQRGEAAYDLFQDIGKVESEWKKTSFGCWSNASLCINYFHICNQFYGLIFCNISYSIIAQNWHGLSKDLLEPANADLASFLSGCKKTISFKFAQPVVECAPYAAPEGVDPPAERIVFPAAAYTEHLQFCNSMMDVPTRQAQVEEATKEYGPAAKKRKAEDAGVAAEEGDLEELEEDDILEMDMSHVAI